jgi:hypothetical protein
MRFIQEFGFVAAEFHMAFGSPFDSLPLAQGRRLSVFGKKRRRRQYIGVRRNTEESL